MTLFLAVFCAVLVGALFILLMGEMLSVFAAVPRPIYAPDLPAITP